MRIMPVRDSICLSERRHASGMMGGGLGCRHVSTKYRTKAWVLELETGQAPRDCVTGSDAASAPTASNTAAANTRMPSIATANSREPPRPPTCTEGVQPGVAHRLV